jgi:hypothetical protein
LLPELQEAVAAAPESPTAQKLAAAIGSRLANYGKLSEKHGLSAGRQEELLKKMADFSDY